MKKAIVLLVLVLTLVLAGCSSGGNIKIGYAVGAAHGTRSFTAVTVAMNGDKIVGASIDEFQFMANDGSVTPVPNSDLDFGANYPEGQTLISKRINDSAYSALMKDHAGATQGLVQGWTVIENFAKGKTIAEISNVDTVASTTLVDAKGYLQMIAEAAKNAK